MSGFFGMFGNDDENIETTESTESTETTNTTNTVADGKLRLRKEELDINKNKEQTGEVTLSKEIVEEQKTVDVPVIHEEVIIERRTLDNEPSDSPIGAEEPIRIPVNKEKVEVGKHTIITGEVSAHKREVEETQHIEQTLKREEARVNKTGDPVIADQPADQLQ